MARPPRSQKPHVPRPSPLQQVQLTRPLSTAAPESIAPEANPPAETGLVRDPNFWKRFSTAIHNDEIDFDDEEKGTKSNRKTSKSSSGSLEKEGNEWLAQQAKEKRHCKTVCVCITVAVALVVIGAAVVGWYFTNAKNI